MALTTIALLLAASAIAADEPADELADRPAGYVVEYPQAKRWCAPVRSTFFEVTQAYGIVNGKRFRQKKNGGYGLPVVDQVGGKNLLHVGADLGWYQVGAPVFAVANGVVRQSTGPDFGARAKPTRTPPPNGQALPWGNFVAIEHHLGEGEYVTTVYGHLATRRLVQVGDVVEAGQPIGTIGRQHFQINGGYKPHLHFGVRQGRMAEVGATLLKMTVNGRPREIVLAEIGQDWSNVEVPDELRLPLRLEVNGQKFEVLPGDGQPVVKTSLLRYIHRPDFALVGYALTTDGWHDPVKFLRQHRADTAPAPYRRP